jgi:hypothetical protein
MMKKSWLVGLIPAVLAIAVGVCVVALLLIKVLWSWTVPDLFPGAVAQGLVAKDIGWLTAFKLALFVAVVAGIAGIRPSGRSE